MDLAPIQQIAVFIAASTILFALTVRFRARGSANTHKPRWIRSGRESSLGILTGGFVALAALAVAHVFPQSEEARWGASSGQFAFLPTACVVATLLLLCCEPARWTGHRLAMLMAALVPWLLVPEWAGIEGARLPAEQIGLVSAALYRVVFSGARFAREAERARYAAVEATGDGVIVVDALGALVDANSTGRRIFEDLTSAGTKAKRNKSDQPPRLPDRVRNLLEDPDALHFTLRNSTDVEYEIWLGAADLRAAAGPNRALIVRDVSERNRDAKHLQRLAHYDSLTGLANRRLFVQQLETSLKRAPDSSDRVALLYIDLDRFKEINDTLGHGAGDELLRVIAKRFMERLRAAYPPGLRGPQAASVARLGGDEFAVIIPEPKSLKEIENFAARLLEAIGEPIILSDREIASSGSIGIALYPRDGRDVETLVKHADSALYGAKRLGRNRYERYQPEFSRDADRIRVIEQEMRGAIERGEFQLQYQPKIDVATETVAGFEALLRWKNRELGHVGPDEFIPIAEERGLIASIGAWCIEEACRQLREWKEQGFDPAPVAVNVSSAQFIGLNLQTLVEGALAENELEPTLLELELTERLLLEDNEHTSRALSDIKALGVPLALDDFGTGYSALTYLNRFPLSVVKMDRGLLIDIETSESAAGIAAAVISMCHSLGLKVVAEGVDAEGQLELLREMSCDLIQGFLYSPSLSAVDAAKFLRGPGEERPKLSPKPDVIPSVAELELLPRLEMDSDDWETSVVEKSGSTAPVTRALLIDDTGSLKDFGARLQNIGVEVHDVTTAALSGGFRAPGDMRISMVVSPADGDLYVASHVMDTLSARPGSHPVSHLVAGEEPGEEVRELIREAGARWVLWAPFNDSELRFLARAASASDHKGVVREDTRIPMDTMAWIRARARRDVGVLSSLSRRGAFIDMAEPLEVDSSLRLEFELPTGRISTFAKVAYQRVYAPDSESVCENGIGVSFYGTDPASAFAIGELVDSNAAKFRP